MSGTETGALLRATSDSSSDVVDPTQYMPTWIVFAVALAALVGFIVWAVLHFTWRAAERRAVRDTVTAPEAMKAEYLRSIVHLRESVHEGELDEREAHRRLGRLVRTFLAENLGLDVASATAREISADPTAAHLVRVLELMDAPTYAPESPVAFDESARAVEEAIRAWS